jgi:hypothetical protein
MLLLSWWQYSTGPEAAIASTAVVLLGIFAFARMGHGIWFKSRVGGVFKGVALMLAVQVAGLLGGLLVGVIDIVGALTSP